MQGLFDIKVTFDGWTYLLERDPDGMWRFSIPDRSRLGHSSSFVSEWYGGNSSDKNRYFCELEARRLIRIYNGKG